MALIYAQNPARVKMWADRVVTRWEFDRIVTVHWESPLRCTQFASFTSTKVQILTLKTPLRASPKDLERAFAFLDDDCIGLLLNLYAE
jgi:hypothetical protein